MGAHAGDALIDTNVSLEIAIITSWFQFICWVVATVCNVWLAKKMAIDLTFEMPMLPAWLRRG